MLNQGHAINVASEIRDNAIQAINEGVSNAIFYGEFRIGIDEMVSHIQSSDSCFNGEVVFQAFERVVLQCSDGTLEITPSGIQIK